jgi:hypothetical protein
MTWYTPQVQIDRFIFKKTYIYIFYFQNDYYRQVFNNTTIALCGVRTADPFGPS